MATYDLDRSTLSFFHERFSRLTPMTPGLWGTMDLCRALRHVAFVTDLDHHLRQFGV